jgi:glycosyltransferase involved in cell wall biosynthesis
MESLALTKAGYKVSVICPTAPDDLLHEVIDDVSIYRYPAPKDALGLWGYLWEFAYSMYAAFRLARRVLKVDGFDVIQGCNPPDTFFVVGWFFRKFCGKKYIFDHHDLSPELYGVRFGKGPQSLVSRVLLWLERCTFNTADVVISTNESFKQIAVERGHKPEDRVFVVRNGPDITRFKPRAPNPDFLMGRRHLVCYVGVMARQDGLEYLLEAIAHIVHDLKREDVTFTLIGSGDRLASLKRMVVDLRIQDWVVFTGRIRNDELLATYLSTSDVCVAPDPRNALNDKCTLIKIPEYMAIGKPIVSFDLAESRFSAQEAALYATPNDAVEFGDKIVFLLDNPDIREGMGEFGTKRVRDVLSWSHSVLHLLKAYETVLGNTSSWWEEERERAQEAVGSRGA